MAQENGEKETPEALKSDLNFNIVQEAIQFNDYALFKEDKKEKRRSFELFDNSRAQKRKSYERR